MAVSPPLREGKGRARWNTRLLLAARRSVECEREKTGGFKPGGRMASFEKRVRRNRVDRAGAEQLARKLDSNRKLPWGLAGATAIVLALVFCLLDAAPSGAQSPVNPAKAVVGTWQGTLHSGRDLRTVIKITRADDETLKSTFYSIDQNAGSIPVTSTTLDGSTLKFSIDLIDGSYEGKLSADGNSITGTWKQGANSLPLNFARATPETEWAIPTPPPRLPPMAADANPTFEVATIKPTKPGTPGKYFSVQGRRFMTGGTTLTDMIKFAYGVHQQQIVGAPDWMSSEKYDISAEPDGEGAPNDRQWKTMLQKLLADRFQLKFHHEKRELTVYALTIGKGGPKLTKSTGDPNGLPSMFFRGLGYLPARNATMADFAGVLQGAVLNRPVVDQTGLTGRFDFTLKWTPDETQFSDLGGYKPPATENPDAPPDLFTAIQQELGLKLESTKAPVDVLVIDHVERPSAN